MEFVDHLELIRTADVEEMTDIPANKRAELQERLFPTRMEPIRQTSTDDGPKEIRIVFGRRQLAVDLQAQTLRVDVILRDVGVNWQVDADLLQGLGTWRGSQGH